MDVVNVTLGKRRLRVAGFDFSPEAQACITKTSCDFPPIERLNVGVEATFLSEISLAPAR